MGYGIISSKMLKVFTILSVALCISSVHNFDLFDDALVINTTGGLIQGEILSSGIFSNYYSWKGIPYAQPPVGDLRFRAPLPHNGWDGVRDGTVHGFNCPSSSPLSSATNEDCLFLNVYSPNVIGRSAVMVWIHGGGFSGGSGDSFIYGPDHFMGENVVVVTLNYRLGALGYLSTEDEHAPGNYGMKDIVLALQWLQQNILAFGGDPNSITIFGESAGGAAVHYLVLSHIAQGLFHRAISQSGSALNPWAFQPRPASHAYQLARSLGITTTSNAEIVAALRNVDADAIVAATPGFLDGPIIRGTNPIFVPSVDPQGIPASEQFLSATPIDIIKSASFNPVPYISGFNDGEGIMNIRELFLDSSVFPTINNNPELLVPGEWNIPIGSQASRAITDEIRNFYFRGTTLGDDMRVEWSQYITDVLFGAGIDYQNRLHSERQGNPIYYYLFSFDGSLNLVKTLLFLTEYPGAAHADDLFYMFSMTRFPPPLLPTNAAINTRRRMVRMWSNFAKFSDPTPSTDLIVITQRWTRIMGAQEFLEIGDSLSFGRFPLRERMEFWNRLRSTYTNL